ncbi:hypothetical protein ACF1E9_14760 [Streptomyces roseolus]|uniref:hypothetical protein n=1 Tax=Streptomyces roseolus TaxID=67358 RepID=UPI0036F88329
MEVADRLVELVGDVQMVGHEFGDRPAVRSGDWKRHRPRRWNDGGTGAVLG